MFTKLINSLLRRLNYKHISVEMKGGQDNKPVSNTNATKISSGSGSL